jgi:hypothetical protein
LVKRWAVARNSSSTMRYWSSAAGPAIMKFSGGGAGGGEVDGLRVEPATRRSVTARWI